MRSGLKCRKGPAKIVGPFLFYGMGVPFRFWGPHDIVCPYDYGQPAWDGSRVSSLLITNHFGLGDTIMMWRFVPQVMSMVDHIVFRCDEELVTLFSQFDIEIINKEADKPVFDSVIDMSAIPEVLKIKTENVSGEPYLKVAQQDNLPSVNLSKFSGIKVGICWCGNPFNPRDVGRSLSPNAFEMLSAAPNLCMFSIQKHMPPPDYMRDLRPFMADMNCTAYLIDQLDLIITVDTSVAHLAGAMGRPVWMILTQPQDIRWEQKGDDTGWYDSMRIFRMKQNPDELIWELCAALAQF